MRILFCIAFLGFIAFSCPAQDISPAHTSTEHFALHARGGFLLNYYSADFRSFQGVVDCGLFTEGNGHGPAFSLTGELPVSARLTVGMGIGLFNRSGTLTATSSFPARDTATGEVVSVHTDNTLEAKLSYLEFQPEVRYNLFQNFIKGPLRALGGLRFGLPLSATFAQAETITSPENAAFISSGQRTQRREIGSGTIKKTLLGFGISTGIENMLMISKHMHFTQEVVFDYNFSDITSDANWKVYGIRFEIGLRYSFMSEPPPEPEPVKEIPPVEPPVVAQPPVTPPTPTAKIMIDAISPVSASLEVGNELLASLPLVTAVFFEQNSATIPSKYTLQSTTRPQDAVAAHRNILSDIAEIIQKNPNATIIVNGATSGKNDEPDGMELARQRAEAVHQALLSLGIPDRAMKVTASVYPQNPSNQDFSGGREENRRVDIAVHNAPLQTYVSQRQFSQVNGVIHTTIQLTNFPAGKKAVLSSNVSDTSLLVASSTNITIPFRQRAGERASGMDVVVNLQSNDPQVRSSDTARLTLANLQTKEVALKMDNFEPILRFDYNSSKLSESNKDLLRQMLDLLPDGTTITILGSADMLGSDERNEKLSHDRAEGVDKFIRSTAGSKFTIVSSGAKAKFSDETPEGRFLNRSIRIRVSR